MASDYNWFHTKGTEMLTFLNPNPTTPTQKHGCDGHGMQHGAIENTEEESVAAPAKTQNGEGGAWLSATMGLLASTTASSCPSTCKCSSAHPSNGGQDVNSDGYCHAICSKPYSGTRYCGQGAAYTEGDYIDCSACAPLQEDEPDNTCFPFVPYVVPGNNNLVTGVVVPPYSQCRASSTWADQKITDNEHKHDHGLGNLDSGLGWAAKEEKVGEWWQMDLGKVQEVIGVVTQGRSHSCSGCAAKNDYVESYKVKVSDDGSSWTDVDDGNVFTGNVASGGDKVRNDFSKPLHARYVRIVVQSWNGWIVMRSGVVVAGLPATAREIKFNKCFTCLHQKVDTTCPTCKDNNGALTFPDKHGCVKMPPDRFPDAGRYEYGLRQWRNGENRKEVDAYGAIWVFSKHPFKNDAANPETLGAGEGKPLQTNCRPKTTGASLCGGSAHGPGCKHAATGEIRKTPTVCTTMGVVEKPIELGDRTETNAHQGVFENLWMNVTCALWKLVVCVDLLVAEDTFQQSCASSKRVSFVRAKVSGKVWQVKHTINKTIPNEPRIYTDQNDLFAAHEPGWEPNWGQDAKAYSDAYGLCYQHTMNL
jgi:hypothetical protein